MKTNGSGPRRIGRYLVSMMIAVAGVVAIVGSGGGLGFPDLSFDVPVIPPVPRVTVSPSRLTVEQGGTAVFTATTSSATGPVSFQWLRNGATIVGATSATYTLVGANLGDDGANFSVVLSAGNGSAMSTARLQVSPFAGIVFQDGEFLLPDWAVASIKEPQSGPTFTVSRSTTGGNPDAFRSITYELPAGASRVMVFHAALAATYDPVALGAIYGIDFGFDCLLNVRTDSVLARAMIEQNGRRFVAGDTFCSATSDSWQTYSGLSFGAENFILADGPACGTGETCPDFSASGAPIRLGFATQDRVFSSSALPSTLSMGIDNWRATVWRK